MLTRVIHSSKELIKTGLLCSMSSTIFGLSDQTKLPHYLVNQLTQFYKDRAVLVTGGCGFIGSHVAELLVSYGANVTILDDLSTGFEHNIAHIRDNIRLIKGSITNQQTCLQATVDQTVIFHLAAFTSVPDSVARPHLCHEININGTFNILNAARLNKVERLVLSSSSAVYGQAEGISCEIDPCNPLSPYGYSKLIDELLCQQFSKNYGIITTLLRYFNVYGPRQNPHAQYAAVVAKFSDNMRDNKPLTIFGDGKQTRDFVEVNYVAHANLMAGMLADNKTSGDVFNIASGKSINLFDLIDMLKKEFPSYTGAILFKEARAGDVLHTGANCTKFNQRFLQ
jgi:UDP-glucose 4-epimerase